MALATQGRFASCSFPHTSELEVSRASVPMPAPSIQAQPGPKSTNRRSNTDDLKQTIRTSSFLEELQTKRGQRMLVPRVHTFSILARKQASGQAIVGFLGITSASQLAQEALRSLRLPYAIRVFFGRLPRDIPWMPTTPGPLRRSPIAALSVIDDREAEGVEACCPE
jgi:hypothetical protein